MNDNEEKIELVKKYSESHANFNLDFILSLEDAILEYGDLTDAQSNALDNIIQKFRIK